MKEYIYKDRESLYQSVADKCAEQLTADTDKKGEGSFIVPGGTTPAPVFSKLSMMPLQWADISVSPSDERWIDVDHKQSNQFLIEQTLLINHASAARFIGLKNKSPTASEGEGETEKRLQQLARPASVTMLGMGPDGHFASLFPGCPQIKEALDIEQNKRCIGIDARGCAVAGEYTNRMSLTLSSLINSNLVIILITGNEKLKVVRDALAKKSDTPVASLLNQTKTPVEIHWAE